MHIQQPLQLFTGEMGRRTTGRRGRHAGGLIYVAGDATECIGSNVRVRGDAMGVSGRNRI